MDKQETLEALCALCTEVRDAKSKDSPSDCFCGQNELASAGQQWFQMSPGVIEFIIQTVREKLN